MGKILLGYWNIRGYGEPIRYLLHYKNVQFEDKRYLNDGTWQKEKFTLGLDFPNLPYYFDDKVKLTHSNTILRYLAKKYDLDGKTDEEKLRVSLAEQHIIDFRAKFWAMLFTPEFEKLKKEYLEQTPLQLNIIARFLGNRKFLVGDHVTYVDFMLYDTLDHMVLFSKTILDLFPTLKAYHERMAILPELQAYFKSSTYARWPIVLEPSAKWGNKGEIPK